MIHARWAERPIAVPGHADVPWRFVEGNADIDLSVDLARWFKPDELETCPRCGAQRLVPAEPGSTVRICLDCGAIDLSEPN